MKNKLIHLCFVVYLLIPIQNYAQDTNKNSFTLKQAISYALKHNRNVLNSDLNIQAAERQKWETTAIGLPQVNGEIKYLNGIVQQFPGIDFNNDGLIDIGAKHSLTPSITLSQLIFDGSYLVGLQSAKVFLEISKNAEIKTKNQIEVEITKAYTNALLVEESIKITQQNSDALKANLVETKQLYINGLVEEESVEQLQLTLASVENNLYRLKQLKEISYNVLKLLFSIELKETITLTDTLESLFKEESSFTKISYFNNIDVKISENNLKAKELLYKLEKAKLLPSISAFINANYIGNNREFSPLFSSEQKYVNTVNFGATISIPIFSSFAGSSKIKRAKINQKIAENELVTTKSKTQIEIKNAEIELEFAAKNHENKKKSLELATKIEKKNQAKFKEGISSNFDLRQAQLQLYSAQQEYLQSIVDIINKKAALKNLSK